MRINVSGYWCCQIFGWGLFGLVNVLFARIYGQEITGKLITRILMAVTVGIVVTHLLRNIIIERKWLMLSAEKIIIRLFVSIVAAIFIYSLSLVSLFEWFNLSEMNREIRAPFISRVIRLAFSKSIIFIIWILAYYAYYVYQYFQKTKTRGS
ncbi:MAG: hypothetical protein KF862_02775 [Chitinophagaceae bacterium]|nr:hypothetical protein [Chitinophagaceae bacterium]